ncbi:MAG: hypothetical protein J1E59_04550 [Treponema sp.]|nr:hypothetical protein [Treponema sp.]
MKPFFKILISFFLANAFFAAAQVSSGNFLLGVPDAFAGLWERDDRFVMFAESEDFLESRVQEFLSSPEASDDEKNAVRNQAKYVSILLKTFYGWYLDRTAEPESFSSEARFVNDSTCPEAERIRVEFRPLLRMADVVGADQGEGSVWEIFIRYPGVREPAIIPLAIIGGNLYLNFAIKLNTENDESREVTDDETGENPPDELLGFWCSLVPTDGVKVSLPASGENIYSTYITRDSVYTIRYWKTDMEYSQERAFFSDGGKTFSVVKHIQSGGKNFSCTNGRSVTIRNVQKTSALPEVYELDSSATICGLGEPYLRRVQNENSVQTVARLVRDAMSKKAPNPDPPFPPSNLDFHMEEIYRLEEGNLIIQSLRKRNKDFGKLSQ